MHRFLIQFSFLCSVLLFSCSKKTHIGHFTTNPENKAAFAGRELTLNADGTFDMNAWTDSFTVQTDENGNVICDEIKSKGYGVYTIEKNRINLSFTSIDFLEAKVQLDEYENGDSSWYEIILDMKNEKGKRHSPGHISILDSKSNPIGYHYGRGKEAFRFSVRKDIDAAAFTVSMFGNKDFVFLFDEYDPGMHRFEINRCRGFYAPGTEISLPYKLLSDGIEYTNEQGKKIKLYRMKS